MKAAIIAILLPLASFGSVVGFDAALNFATNWVNSLPEEDHDRSPVVKMLETDRNGVPAYYIALRKSGSALFLSADDTRHPVLAMSTGVCDEEGNITLDRRHPLWPMLEHATSNSVAPRVLRAAKDPDAERNRSTWNKFSRPVRPVVKAAPSGNTMLGGEYVLSGFEDGGVLTHWNQTTAVKDFNGSRPLYNYYMHSVASGGAGASGLNLDYPADEFPCGCVATALAAAAQYQGFAGVVPNPSYTMSIDYETNRYDWTARKSEARTLLPGAYDWSVLPSNYGGSAPACSRDSDISDEARELIGRVAFNYGIISETGYGYSSSGASYPLRPMNSYLVSLTADLIDHAHVNKGGYISARGTSDPVAFARAVEVAIRVGEPVVMAVRGAQGGHCILAVGVRGSTDASRYIKVFMGWGGLGDTWFYGAGTNIGTMFSSVDGADVTGGVGHPTLFDYVVYNGCSTGMGATAYPPLKVTASPSATVIANSSSNVFGIAYTFPYRPESDSSVSRISASASFRADPFQYGGVTLTPSSSSHRWSSYYEFIGTHPHRYVYTGGDPARSSVYSVSLSATGSHAYGFPHGTPEGLSDFVEYAFTNNRPVVIISGRDGTSDAVVQEFKTGRTAGLLSGCHVYFIDHNTDGRDGVKDWVNSYMVLDPFKGIDVATMWDQGNVGRLAYGTFTDASLIYDVVNAGKTAYAALPVSRENAYGVYWYALPFVDTNPYTVPASTTSLDIYTLRATGKTSLKATSLVTVSRSNQSSTDTTVRYFDFSKCPCVSTTAQMFRNFKALVSVRGLPSGFTSVPNWCFADCTSLSDMSGLPSGAATLNTGVFYGCTAITSLETLPATVKSLGQQCFQNCSNLSSLKGIRGVTSLGSNVFSGLNAISGPIEIDEWPDAVHSVPSSAFQNRTGLKSIDGLPDHVTSYGSSAFYMTGVSGTLAPKTGVTSIGDSCFRSCTGITSFVAPATLSSVGQYCFYGCSSLVDVDFTAITDVSSLSLSQYLFNSSKAITVRFSATMTTVQSMAYYGRWGLPSGSVIKCSDGDINL